MFKNTTMLQRRAFLETPENKASYSCSSCQFAFIPHAHAVFYMNACFFAV